MYLEWSGSIPKSSEYRFNGSWSITRFDAPRGAGGGICASAGLITILRQSPQHAQQQRTRPRLTRRTWMTTNAKHILYKWGAVDGYTTKKERKDETSWSEAHKRIRRIKCTYTFLAAGFYGPNDPYTTIIQTLNKQTTWFRRRYTCNEPSEP
jgi:hypothetical protein